jgi:hypothetical protein
MSLFQQAQLDYYLIGEEDAQNMSSVQPLMVPGVCRVIIGLFMSSKAKLDLQTSLNYVLLRRTAPLYQDRTIFDSFIPNLSAFQYY